MRFPALADQSDLNPPQRAPRRRRPALWLAVLLAVVTLFALA